MATSIKRTFGTPTNNKIFTLSTWYKKTGWDYTEPLLSGGSSSRPSPSILMASDGRLKFSSYNGSGYDADLHTSALYRDNSAWHHIVVAVDTTQATASNRIKFYVNGEQITSFSTSTYPSQNFVLQMNEAHTHVIGGYTYTGVSSNAVNSIFSHYHFIDGTAYDATAFGSTDSVTGEWSINTSPSVTYGNNGFFIFKDSNSLTDQSGNNNNWTLHSGTITKTEDNPSNVFCTNNPLWKQESTRYLTHTLGNTMISGGGSNTWYQTPGTLAFNSGKFYWECKWNAGTNLTQNHAGVIDYEKTQESGQFRAKTGSVLFTNEDGGEVWTDATASTADYGTLAQNDILGVAVDMDATTPTVKFYKNGSLHVTINASSLAGKFVTPAQMIYASGEFQLNFGNGYFGTTAVSSAGTNASGNGIFEYDVPTGYTALSTKGLNL